MGGLGSEILGAGGEIADTLGNLVFLERSLSWKCTPEVERMAALPGNENGRIPGNVPR